MTGLSVLYARNASKHPEWEDTADRDKTSRLREVYWVEQALSKRQPKVPFRINFWIQVNRANLGRRQNDPGDYFDYRAYLIPQAEDRFSWYEVVEVYTTVPPIVIEAAMRAWNNIPGYPTIEFNKFRGLLRKDRPSRIEQRIAADRVIEAIKRKLTKNSYQDLLQKHGYGTLVVGLPLWFATRPDDPPRPENAVDDFMTRIGLGLLEIERKELRRRDCAFRRVIVTWDTTPDALREWYGSRSAEYEDVANARSMFSLESYLNFAGILEKTMMNLDISESEASSMRYTLEVEVRKKAVDLRPYPKEFDVFGKEILEGVENQQGYLETMRQNVVMSKLMFALAGFGLLSFVRKHGFEGLKRWVIRKLSISQTWRIRMMKQKSQRFYRESIRRGRFLDKTLDGDVIDEQWNQLF